MFKNIGCVVFGMTRTTQACQKNLAGFQPCRSTWAVPSVLREREQEVLSQAEVLGRSPVCFGRESRRRSPGHPHLG